MFLKLYFVRHEKFIIKKLWASKHFENGCNTWQNVKYQRKTHNRTLLSFYFPQKIFHVHVENEGSNLSRTNCFTELARNASLLTAGVTSQGMFTPEPGWEGSLLKRVVDGGRLFENVAQGNCHTSSKFLDWEVKISHQ